eukprot:Nitzschia sp. Nitz4//scaffold35_size145790//29916//31421//NITZ4_003014-RA/size145790-snap-gene-0.6-mRNA-1//1//CDS//3329549076//4183//frame0
MPEWTYVCEGGKHALFESDQFEGNLLRIEKGHLAQSSGWPGPIHQTWQPRDQKWDDDPVFYHRMIVAPKLQPYVDVPIPYQIPWGYLKYLRIETLAKNVIPPSRLKDWSTEAERSYSSTPIGCLIPDYRNISLSIFEAPKTPHSQWSLSIELKPKAGYLAFSPLVNPKHRIKYLRSRFSLLQELHQQGLVEKGWTTGGKGIVRSSYDPLDLYSKDPDRIKVALRHLLECPQNNLCVKSQDQLLVHHSLPAVCVEQNFRAMEESLGISTKCDFDDFLVEVMCSCLSTEDVLEKLRKLQMLDILDADGVGLVYGRMLDLCDGSHDVVAAELGKEMPRGGEHSASNRVMSESPFQLEAPLGASLSELLETIECCRNSLMEAYPTLPSSNLLDDYHSRALKLIDRLSLEDCRYLLSNWLLSLAIIFVCLQPYESGLPPTDDQSKQSCLPKVSRLHLLGSGVLEYSNQVKVAYTIRVIDVDKKPPEKLKKRGDKESVFSLLS